MVALLPAIAQQKPHNVLLFVDDGLRADTRNFMAAAGPSFKTAHVDVAPTSNADIGMTIARLLDLDISRKGGLVAVSI